MPFLPALLGAISKVAPLIPRIAGGALSSGIGSAIGPDPYKWWRDFVLSGRERGLSEAEYLRGLAESIFNPLRESSLGDYDLSQQLNRELYLNFLRDSLGEGILSPRAARETIERYMNMAPGRSGEAVSGLADLVNRYRGPEEIASRLFSSGGWSPQAQDALDFWRREMLGEGAPNASLADVGLDLLGRRGQNEFTRRWLGLGTSAAESFGMDPSLNALSRHGLDILSSQGWSPRLDRAYGMAESLAQSRGLSPEISSVLNMGLGLASSRGLSPELVSLLGQSQSLVSSGGLSPVNEALLRQGLDIMSRRESEVMSPERAAQVAREQAHAEQLRQSSRALRQALARGGGAVVSGLQGRGMAEFADAAAAAADEAARKALLAQQGLSADLARMGLTGAGMGLDDATRRLLAGIGLGTDALRIASSREGMGYNAALESLARAGSREALGYNAMLDTIGRAISREGLGAQMVPSAVQAGVSRMEPLLRLAQAGLGHELQAMGLGSSMLDQYNQARHRAGSGFSDVLRSQQGYTINAGQLLNQFLNSQAGALGNIFDYSLRLPYTGAQIGRMINESVQGANPYSLGSGWLSNWRSDASRNLLNLYGPAMSGYQGIVTGVTSPFFPSGVRPESPWQGPLLGAVGRGITGMSDFGARSQVMTSQDR